MLRKLKSGSVRSESFKKCLPGTRRTAGKGSSLEDLTDNHPARLFPTRPEELGTQLGRVVAAPTSD